MQQPNRPPRIAFFVILCLVAASARAQNTTPATAAHLTIGQIPVQFSLLNNTTDQRWYDFAPKVGRSYCVGMTTAEFETNPTNSFLSIFQGDGTTLVTSNNDIATEPDAQFQSRACFLWPATSVGFIEATQTVNASRFYHMRIVETTMFCPWFFIAGDYNAFTLIRNTTNTSVSATVNWRNGAGAIVGTTTVAIPGNGNVALNANTFVDNATTSTGSIEIAHNGSEEALTASTTTLSPTTGIGFDAGFERRRPW